MRSSIGELIELVAAAGDLDALREVAGGDRGGGGGDIGDSAAKQAADDDRTGCGHRQHDRHGPDQRVGQQIAELHPDLNVASDQQVVTVRQFVAIHERQRAHAGAADLELPPLTRLVHHRGPGIEIAGDPVHGRIDQQINRVVIDIGGEAILDGADETFDAALVESLDQALRVGANRRSCLAVEQPGGEPPKKHRQRGGTDRQQDRVDEAETKTGRAEESGFDHSTRCPRSRCRQQ